MQEYISKLRKLGHNDTLNKNVFNSVIDQLQHNIDLLYRSLASSTNNWNISELVYGNLMDYDQVGDKRYVNGGLLDSLEKILTFQPVVGNVTYEEFATLNNNYWLNWQIPQGLTQNVALKRNIVVPESLKHQTILVGIKLIAFTNNIVTTNERFEIYVNGTYCGTGETDVISSNRTDVAKTIYGVYSLTGEETNLEISLERSFSNNSTPSNYSIKIEAMFVGLHTLGVSSHILNFPLIGSKFSNDGNDIENYYDFQNNSIKPIPSFIATSQSGSLSGAPSESLVVNLTHQGTEIIHDYYLSNSNSGDGTGSDVENLMSVTEFFSKDSFTSDRVNVYLQEFNNYDEFKFNKNNYHIYVNNDITNIKINSLIVDDISSVIFEVDPNVSNTSIEIGSIEVKGNSVLKFKAINNKNVILYNKGVNVTESSNLFIETGAFSTPVVSGGTFLVTNNSHADITILNSSLNNTDPVNGFGLSTGPIKVTDSSVSFSSTNSAMRFHIGRGELDTAIDLKKSDFDCSGFFKLTTSSIDKKFLGTVKSNFEINGDIQLDGGVTAFTDLNLSVYSSFGSTVAISGINQNINDSVIYGL